MTAAFRTMTLAAASVLSFVAAGPALADHGSALARVDQLSRQIQAESRSLYYELRAFRYGDHETRAALSEVGQIYSLATRIHDASHGHGSVRGMDQNVHSLKRLVHHVEEHLVGHQYFRSLVNRIDNLTHELEDAVHDLDDGEFFGNDPWIYRGDSVNYGPSYSTQPSYYSSGSSYYTRPGVGYGSSGVTIGGRGFSFTIGR